MTKFTYLYVLDTMADWEPAYLVAELNTARYFRKDAPQYPVKTIGLSKEPITSMGGIHISPDITVDEFDANHAAALILPGADTWLETKQMPMLSIVQQCLESNVLVAAICGATAGLAQAGILDKRQHTSNDIAYLQAVCPNYKGESLYTAAPAVTDGNLITASGLAPLEFAHEVLKYLDVIDPQTLNAWFKLYQTRDPKYFFALMGKD